MPPLILDNSAKTQYVVGTGTDGSVLGGVIPMRYLRLYGQIRYPLSWVTGFNIQTNGTVLTKKPL